ncbi:laccase-1 [Thozetella sp. PMI_491]|nr:laccase-1 [Thozetella sp. PMI_491]
MKLLASLLPLASREFCQNGPHSRNCWGEHNISTNYYDTIPEGKIVPVWLSIEQGPCAPDGFNRTCMTFNGTIPGPAIIADWGDTLEIHVTNNMENQGAAIHWHGIRQLNSFAQDGVPGVTQCPIGPRQNGSAQGETITYRFKVTQYGTTWYHSHLSLQYAEGMYGPMILNGPATYDYDVDLGAVFLQDWSHTSAFKVWTDGIQGVSGPVESGNGATLNSTLINGMNTYHCATIDGPACISGGKKFETVFQSGTKYLIRLINVAIDAQFQFSIDGHTLTVIANDLVPIEPYNTSSVLISIGQRYDVVVEANAPIGDYWMRGGWVDACARNPNAKDMTGIVRYDPSSTSEPATSSNVTAPTSCNDEPQSNLKPWLKLNVTNLVQTTDEVLTTERPNATIFHWVMGSSNLEIQWEDPTLKHIINGNFSFDPDYNVVTVDKKSDAEDQFAVLVIENTSNLGFLAHPIHLHGHDFWILNQTSAKYDPTLPFDLTRSDLVRRDVAMLPAAGHLAIAFKLDNPGSWLVHCHIAWHASQGLGLEFLESGKSIVITPTEKQTFSQTCDDWVNKYMNSTWPRDDSGI